MFKKISVVTAHTDTDGTHVQHKSPGVLIAPGRALHIDVEWGIAVLERVTPNGTDYQTTGGAGSVLLEVKITDLTVIERFADLSAAEFLALLIPEEEASTCRS